MDNILKDNKFNDQLSAILIDSINNKRITDELLQLNIQDEHFIKAMMEIDGIREFIGSPEKILGSDSTKHGEIAEVIEVGIRRANSLLDGLTPSATFEGVGRTAPEDYIINNINVQSKFINGTNNTLRSVLDHMKKHPNFSSHDSFYHIPKDQYDIIMKISDGYDVEELSLRTQNTILKHIKTIEKATNRPFSEVVKPGVSNYDEVQKGVVHKTVDGHTKKLSEENAKKTDKIRTDHKPNLAEGLKATGMAATVGATLSLTTSLYAKSKEGKIFYKGELSSEDWQEIGISTAKGGVIGGVSGGSIYLLTNYAGLSAPFAGAIVSATKGIESLYGDYNDGKIALEEFYELGMILCSESAIVGFATAAGQAIVPIPILGAVLGSLAGTLFTNALGSDDKITTYMIQKDLEEYLSQLDEESRKLVKQITDEFNNLGVLTQAAFDFKNNQKLLNLSVELAFEYGVSKKDVLETIEEIDDFMLS